VEREGENISFRFLNCLNLDQHTDRRSKLRRNSRVFGDQEHMSTEMGRHSCWMCGVAWTLAECWLYTDGKLDVALCLSPETGAKPTLNSGQTKRVALVALPERLSK